MSCFNSTPSVISSKSEGKNAWEKCEKAEITVTQSVEGSSPAFKLTSKKDLSSVTEGYFIGGQIVRKTDGATLTFIDTTNCTYTNSNGTYNGTWTYNGSTQTITCTFDFSIPINSWYFTFNEETVYVTSNNAEAYPNGGEQDGFWYEKVGDCKTYTGTYTPASSSQTITIANPFGSAGKVKSVYINWGGANSYSMTSIHKNLEVGDTYACIGTSMKKNDASVSVTITDTTITFRITNNSYPFYQNYKYYWEVMGVE